MRKSTILVVAVAALLACCQTPRTTKALFRHAEALMEPAPDSALTLLNSLDKHQLRSRAARARFALLYSQALDKNYIDMTTDSVIAPAVEYYSNHGSVRDKANTHFYLGRIFSNAGYSGEAVKQMLAAEKYAERAEMTKLLSMIYNCRANLYFSQYSFEEAIQMYDRADSCCRVEGRILNSALMIQNKAKTYILMRDYKAAETSLQKTMHLYDSLGANKYAAKVVNSLVIVAIETGSKRIDTLKQFLHKSYRKYTSGIIPYLDNSLWARIYLLENKIDSARYFGLLTLQDAKNTPNQKGGALTILSRIEEQAGNYHTATEYWKDYYKIFDSITYAEKKHLIQLVEKRYQNQQLQHENELLQMHNRILFCIGALIFMAISFSFILILRHRRRVIRRKSAEIAQHQQLIGQLKDDYTNLREQYDQLSDNIKGDSEEEANLLRALENRLSSMQRLLDMAYTGECKPQAFYKAFKEQAVIMNSDERAFSDLQYLVNKRSFGVIDYLRKTYPALTNSEIDMLSMILFGFTFDCIRLIYNHDNVDSLYSRRTKIREKLQLPPRFRIERYLEELVEQLKNGDTPKSAANA